LLIVLDDHGTLRGSTTTTPTGVPSFCWKYCR
jgi:hypothetical protein